MPTLHTWQKHIPNKHTSHVKQTQWNSYQSLFVLRNFAQQIFVFFFLSFSLNDLHRGGLKVDLNLSCHEFLHERLKRTSYIKCFCQRSLLLFRNRKMKRRWRTKVSMAHDESEGRSSLKKEREQTDRAKKVQRRPFQPRIRLDLPPGGFLRPDGVPPDAEETDGCAPSSFCSWTSSETHKTTTTRVKTTQVQ